MILIVMSKVLYDKIADLVGNPRVPVVLVGNKKDLEVKKNTHFRPNKSPLGSRKFLTNSYPEREGSNVGGG